MTTRVLPRAGGRTAVLAVLLVPAALGLAACEQQASDITTYGRLTQLDPPCIARPGQSPACFSAPAEQLTTVKKGDCVEVRVRPARDGGLPPVLSIRPIPPASSNGLCDG